MPRFSFGLPGADGRSRPLGVEIRIVRDGVRFANPNLSPPRSGTCAADFRFAIRPRANTTTPLRSSRSVEHVTSVPGPKPETSGSAALAKAWQETCRIPLLPMRHAQECVVRQVLDDAAALGLGVGPEVMADWRRRLLATEPTITHVRAADVARDEGRDS